MSSRGKRRKLLDEKPDFREDIVNLFNGRMWKLSWQNYLKISFRLRKKHSSTELKNLRRWKIKEVEELGITGDGIVALEYEESFEKMSPKERIDEIESFGSEHRLAILTNLLNRMKLAQLRKLLQNQKPGAKNLSKIHTIGEIAKLFFNLSTDIDKRKEEKDNIAFFESSGESFRFVKLCGTQLPAEIILKILGYVNYNFDLINNVGGTCKVFYVLILSSWENVNVAKNKVYQISLLALKNAKSITFYCERKTSFRNEEFDHILKHTNPQRLENLTFKMPIEFYVKSLRYICRKKNKTYLKNLKSMKFEDCERIYRTMRFGNTTIKKKDLELYRKKPWKGIVIRNICPNLESFHHPLNFEIIESLPCLKNLSVDLTIPYRLENSDWNRSNQLNDSQYMGIPEICSPEWESGLEKSQIENLSIRYNLYDNQRKGKVSEFLKEFDNLKSLTVICTVGRINYHSYSTPPSDVSKMFFNTLSPTIRKLVLIDQRNGYSKNFPWSFSSSSFSLKDNNNLTSLILKRSILSGISLDDYTSIIDNFCTSTPQLKHFECDGVLIDEKSIKKGSYDSYSEYILSKTMSNNNMESFKCKFCWPLKVKKNYGTRGGIGLSIYIRRRTKIEIHVEMDSTNDNFEVQLLSRNLRFLYHLLSVLPSEIINSGIRYEEIKFVDASRGSIGELNDVGSFETNVCFELFRDLMINQEEETFKVFSENNTEGDDVKSVTFFFVSED